jgi:PAS domain S-box-containing protein
MRVAIPLRVLILEDVPDDAELSVHALRQAGFDPDWVRVEAEEDYVRSLEPAPELIIADHRLPQFDSVRALERLQERGLGVPFVIVSGAIVEDLAVGLMEHGAADFVLKDRLARLGPAVQRALERKRLRDEKRLAQEHLLASERRFRALIEQSSDGIFLFGAQGEILYSSPSSLRVLGYVPEEIVGRSALELVHADDQSAARIQLDQLLENPGESARGTRQALHKDGSVRWLEWVATNLLAHRDVEAIVVNYRDVTEREVAEEKLRKLSQAVENSPAMVLITDRNGSIEYVNPRFSLVTGYAADEVRGKNARLLKSGETSAEEYTRLWKTITAGHVWRGEFHNKRKDGGFFWASASISPLVDEQGAITHFIGVEEDITARKRSDLLLRARAVELARSNAELEQFAYVASHDLQEPIRMVASYLELLALRNKGQLDEKADKYITYAVEGATRMKSLIDELLRFSRVATNAKPPQPLDSRAALDDAIANLQGTIAARGAVVTYGELPTIIADQIQVIQLFQNLIANAIKFCEGSPHVHIKAEPMVDEWLFSVKDNGIGISREHRQRIFQIFQRLHSREKYPGNGIGLAVCKKVVERHGGRIWVESQEGEGSTFRFTFPIASKSSW